MRSNRCHLCKNPPPSTLAKQTTLSNTNIGKCWWFYHGGDKYLAIRSVRLKITIQIFVFVFIFVYNYVQLQMYWGQTGCQVLQQITTAASIIKIIPTEEPGYIIMILSWSFTSFFWHRDRLKLGNCDLIAVVGDWEVNDKNYCGSND